MTSKYTERINAMRGLMDAAGIAAVVVPQSDPHLSEYLGPHWQVRRWLSGFTGSAGDLVITADKALLWTDSRYFLQAARQLEGTGIELMKTALPGTPTITGWLCSNLPDGSTVGIDGMLFPSPEVEEMKKAFAPKDIRLDCYFDVIDKIWTDRPTLPQDKIFIHDKQYSGRTAGEKMADILDFAESHHADSTFISALDEIAWTLNIRGNDVRHTPVATAFLYLSHPRKILFISESKLDDETRAYLLAFGLEIRDYGQAVEFLESLSPESRVLVEASHTAGGIMDILGDRAVIADVSPVARLKAVKNEVQIAGIRQAMVRDGVALVKFFMELEERLDKGISTTELDVARILHNCRAAGKGYFDESFGTIAGYGPHGAIVHYEADTDSDAVLERKGLLLLDSGAQYLDGTTDITRTVCLGTPTGDERRDFTLVMKGHIALAMMVFPAGTRGTQLDVIARQYLWKEGMTYLHGTGHGVGHFLGVHEGPQSIRLNWVDTPLEPGMVTSNEPGLYRENVHGIRCENLVLCREAMTTDFGTFLNFETLTLFPFDRSLFDLKMMSAEEIEWINAYHRSVYERLAPALENESQRAWLAEKTNAL